MIVPPSKHVSMLIRLPLPQCFCPRGRKLRPWSEKNSDQNSDHPRLCIYWGKEKLRPWSEFLGRENSDHGLSFGCFWGRGRRGRSQCDQRENINVAANNKQVALRTGFGRVWMGVVCKRAKVLVSEDEDITEIPKIRGRASSSKCQTLKFLKL